MNDLSWFIYLADVLPSLATGIGVSFFFISVGFSLLSIVLFITYFDSVDKHHQWPEINKIFPFKYPIGSVIAVFFSLMILLASNLIPSTKTIYMIAASEAGEAVVKSEEGQEMINDLKLIIKGYIKEEVKQE